MESLFKKYIEKIRYIKNIRQIYTDSYMEKYEFTYGDERYSVCIPSEFPGKRPVFFAYKFKPLLHISFDNNICIDRIEDLNFDISIDNYQNILKYYFERFTNVVNAPMPSQEDYLEEYTDYLAYYTNFDMSFYNYVFGSFDTEVVKEIKLYKLKGHSYYFNEEMDITYLLPLNNKTYNKCLFIPMNNYIEIPNSNEISFTYEKFIQFLESGIKIFNPKYNNYKEFLLKMNNLNGFEMYFSVSLARPISETDNRILKFQYVYNNRNDFIIKRGLVERKDQKVLVVGCGSVGSQIVLDLAKNGFMDLTLIDQDIIYPQNIYRHVLGMREIYQLDGNENLTRLSKVTALAKKLLSLYPWIQVNTFTGTFEKYIQNNKLDAFDYIINATGNSVNMRILNKEVLKIKRKIQVLYAWLEAYGFGLHIFIQDNTKRGCIDCMFNSKNNVTIIEPDNYLIRNDNCIGSFTPFGALDIAKLSLALIEKVLKNDFDVNRHICIKNIKNDLKIKFTRFAYLSQDEIDKIGNEIYFEGCNYCGNN